MVKGDFWFPLYYQKLLTSTVGWKCDQFGAYMKLLIYQYDKGFVPNDLAAIGRISPAAKKYWSLLSEKFELIEGVLVNRVMEEIRDKRLRISGTNSENGKTGGRPVLKKETETKPNGYKNEKQYSNISNSNSECDVGYGGTGERAFYPGTEDFNLELPEMKRGAVIQLFAVSKGIEATEKDIEKLWSVFKIQTFTGKKWYADLDGVYSHFINWCQSKKLENGNETNRGNNQPKRGTSEDRIDRAANW